MLGALRMMLMCIRIPDDADIIEAEIGKDEKRRKYSNDNDKELNSCEAINDAPMAAIVPTIVHESSDIEMSSIDVFQGMVKKKEHVIQDIVDLYLEEGIRIASND